MIRYLTDGAAAGVIGCLLAFLTSVLVTPLVIRGASRLRMFDAPDGARRVHRHPVPRLGGVSVFLSVVVAVVLLDPAVFAPNDDHYLAGMLFGASVMFCIGFIDDLRGLPPLAKLAGQLVAATAFVTTVSVPTAVGVIPGTAFSLGWLAAPLTVAWIVGVTNAFNLIDGLNGLASGIAIVAAAGASVCAIALGSGAPPIALLALLGAVAGFGRYNFPNGRIFLGDSGTMSIGFLLSVLLIRAATTPSGTVMVLVPVFAMMVPFLDTGLAIIRRWLRGDALSGADARHIHHRLLAMGMSQTQTVATLWVLSVAFVAFGLLVSLASPVFAGVVSAVGSAVLAIVIIYGTNILAYHELSIAREVLAEGPGRIRRVISDQIHAVDLCESIRSAASIVEMNALLQMNAHTFGLSRMTLRTDTRAQAAELAVADERSAMSGTGWRLDFHVTSPDGEYEAALSMWCESRDGRVSVAERIARILAPVLSEWIEQLGKGELLRPGQRPVKAPLFRRDRRSAMLARSQMLAASEREVRSSMEPGSK